MLGRWAWPRKVENDPTWIYVNDCWWRIQSWLNAKGRAKFVVRTQMRRERVERARYRAKDQRLKVGTSKYRPCDSLVRSESVLSATVSTSRRFSSSEVEKKAIPRGDTRPAFASLYFRLPSLRKLWKFSSLRAPSLIVLDSPRYLAPGKRRSAWKICEILTIIRSDIKNGKNIHISHFTSIKNTSF